MFEQLEQFGINDIGTSGVASKLIPQIFRAFVGKAKCPNDSSFKTSDIISVI
ncbi:hypothetical protein [Flavobacterium frigoris]|uniref:Uncharacterized protein n=1 Tax=Flavobacterium frigoris (strain PS1) TaxID=1086011 RepID=H7FTU1_FLAFP|nr:hypothetical protein [Flavobacterium frigoris]EIA08082.1 hypothetical protein HJ01_02613 [Flavobacterium frigoris PS1]